MDDVITKTPGMAGQEPGMSERQSDSVGTYKSAAGGAANPRKKWTIPVDVYLNSVEPDVVFHIESPIQEAPDTPLVFHNNCHPGFEVVFTLHDETGETDSYSFVKPKDDAIWSQLSNDPLFCPQQAAAPEQTVLKAHSLSENGMVLVVYNENKEPLIGPFRYTLRVTNGTRIVLLDPGGTNMNGPQSRAID